jgi:hypothetical protein
MQRGILGQFRGAREALLFPNISLTLAFFYGAGVNGEFYIRRTIRRRGLSPRGLSNVSYLSSRSSAWAMPTLV